MYIQDANQLLDQPYQAMETGWKRLENGQALVAGRTHMIACSGKMIEWWFGFVHHIEEYLWWHPRDHVWSGWDGERGTGRYLGGSHLVHEYIGKDLYKLRINWRDPATVLDTSRFAEQNISQVMYGRIGDLESPKENPLWFGHLVHLIQDTPDGCVMRSRFWLGDIEGMDREITPELRRSVATDALAVGLLQHCCEEMSILASFLPKLYELYHRPAETGNPSAMVNG